MLQPSGFDYFYGQQAESYTFYRIPKVMFTEERFKGLSCEAKVLYGLMLDRMSLSIKNGWLDNKHRVYIVYSIEDVCAFIGCGSQKAVKLVHELETGRGIGLIEKHRGGMGEANVFYVKNFMLPVEDQTDETGSGTESLTVSRRGGTTGDDSKSADHGKTENKLSAHAGMNRKTDSDSSEIPVKSAEKPDEIKCCDFHNSSIVKITNQELLKSQNKDCENHNSSIVKITNQELRKSQNKDCENHNSSVVKITNQELRKSQTNKTEKSETEKSETESINQSGDTAIPGVFVPPTEMDVIDGIRNYVRERVDYQSFQGEDEDSREEVDELVEMVVDVLRMPDTAVLRINGNEMPAVLVKEHYYKIRRDHIDYVRWTMRNSSRKVSNIWAYMMTALYNSVLTIGHYYQAEANYDVFGGEE